jgi:hypothetical protein
MNSVQVEPHYSGGCSNARIGGVADRFTKISIRRSNSSISDSANGVEIQTPCLIDEIASEFIVRFFCNLLEACLAVDMSCGR